MIELKRVGLFVNQKPALPIIESLQRCFKGHEIQTEVLDWKTPHKKHLDLIVTVGGDGTVLYTLGHFLNAPVLAINYGNVGFLTAGNKEDLHNMIQRVLEGDYIISERSMLECQHPTGVGFAVNEVVVKGTTHMVSLDLSINGTHIRDIRGDGIIVGTATGSTAYLLSAGCPIVMPEVPCIIVTGLNEYNFRSRPLVVTSNSQIHLKVNPSNHKDSIFISFDGKDKTPLKLNDEVLIQESQQRAKLIFMENSYFFNNLSSRLSW